MRLLQTIAGGEHGGAESFFQRLAIALQKTDLEQRVVMRNHPARVQALSAAGVQSVQLPFGGLFDLKTKWAIGREIDRFKPDVVLTWMSRATRKTPAGGGRFVKVARLGGYYNLKYYRDCDHLIGNTRHIVEHFVREGWPAERAHYVPNFVSAERSAPLPRTEFDTPEEVPLILALGRLHETKAFDVLLKSLAYTPEAFLWLAGEGPLRRELEALAVELGVASRVRFLGWRSDVAALFAACDIFVCSSRHETLGNVIIESWAQQRPVVSTETLGAKFLIRDGENGLLAPVGDERALSEALNTLIASPALARKIGLAGEASYRKQFTERAVVQAYLDFFNRVAAKH